MHPESGLPEENVSASVVSRRLAYAFSGGTATVALVRGRGDELHVVTHASPGEA